MDPERCKRVVNAIRDLSKTETDELFKLLYKEHCEFTQNNNGIFFNLTWVSEETMSKIEQFIEFCNQSKTELIRYETLCDVLNHKLYDNPPAAVPAAAPSPPTESVAHPTAWEKEEDAKKAISARVSSSMRFYLLKKRFSKPLVLTSTYENDLIAEEYIL